MKTLCGIFTGPGYVHGQRTTQSFSTPLSQEALISSAEETFKGRTMRKPRNCASVWYQSLFGNCRSCCFQALSEARRAAERSLSASSSQEPPRTTWGYGLIAFPHG